MRRSIGDARRCRAIDPAGDRCDLPDGHAGEHEGVAPLLAPRFRLGPIVATVLAAVMILFGLAAVSGR